MLSSQPTQDKSKQPPAATTTTTKPQSNPLRLLVDKVVFLDLNSYKPLGKVKECLNSIDAKIADCLSKEVNYVITNRDTNDSTTDSNKKIKTSPNSIFGSRSSLINRTQAILEKASKGFISTDILTTARRLGINVLNINDLERYIEKYYFKIKNLKLETNDNNNNTNNSTRKSLNLNESNETNKFKRTDSLITKISPQQIIKTSLVSNPKIYRLKSPYLKFESICKQYKPNYQEFKVWHEISWDPLATKNTSSPFQAYFSDDAKQDDENGDSRERSSSQLDDLEKKNKTFKSPTSSNTITNSTANTSINSTNKLSSSILTNCSNSFLSQKLAKATAGTSLQRRSSSTKLNQMKRKPTGYCECCKQRYDNLKQHLTSAQHENFDRNMFNFKELDEYIDGVLNFRTFLTNNKLDMEQTNEQSINMDEIKNFAKTFNKRRKSLGYSHVQVIQSLESDKDPIYNEINLARFERLDITPRTTAKMKPALERWLVNKEIKFSDRLKTLNQPPSTSNNESDSSKKRKRISLTPKTLQALNQAFDLNSQPNENEIVQLSSQINYDKDLIRIWFNDKTKTVKKKSKKYKQETVLLGLVNETTTLLNTSVNLADSSAFANTSFSPSLSVVSSSANKSFNSKSVISSFLNPNTSQTNTPKTRFKRTPSLASSLQLSSPSNCALFSSNSFSRLQQSGSKLLSTRLDLINSNSTIESIKTDLNGKRLDESTELSCYDDEHSVLNGFNQ